MPVKELIARFSGIARRAPDSPPLAEETARAAKGTDLEVTIACECVVDAARIMDQAAFMIEAITGVDWLAEQQMEIVYDYLHPGSGERVTVRTRVPRDKPELPSISAVYPGANWHERETHDFFGIVFAGHPGLLPLLLPEDARFHPLRKDYAP